MLKRNGVISGIGSALLNTPALLQRAKDLQAASNWHPPPPHPDPSSIRISNFNGISCIVSVWDCFIGIEGYKGRVQGTKATHTHTHTYGHFKVMEFSEL